jgi:dihydrofolate reductase
MNLGPSLSLNDRPEALASGYGPISKEAATMRKLIVTNIVSLDGCYEGPGGNVMALPMDNSFDAYNAERLAAADILLLGANSYDMFRGFWPAVVDNPEASPANRQISRLENAIEKVVVSDSIGADQTQPWTDSTRIVRRADAHEQIQELKRGGEKDILVFGSRTLWNDLLAAGLVDELHLIVGAVVLGDGTPLFVQAPATPLRLLGTQTWDGTDNILVRYATAPQ